MRERKRGSTRDRKAVRIVCLGRGQNEGKLQDSVCVCVCVPVCRCVCCVNAKPQSPPVTHPRPS